MTRVRTVLALVAGASALLAAGGPGPGRGRRPARAAEPQLAPMGDRRRHRRLLPGRRRALPPGQPAPPRHRPALRRPPSEGSVANIAGLRDGSLELAIVQSDVQAEALAGTGAFAAAGPFAEPRAR